MQVYSLPLERPLRGARIVFMRTAPPLRPSAAALAQEASDIAAASADKQAAELQRNLTRVLENVLDDLQDARAHRQQLLDEMQHVAVELACALAAKVVRERTEHDASTILNIAKEMFGRLALARQIKLFVNPADVSALREFLQAGRHDWRDGKTIEIVADSTLSRGDCAAESDAGDLASLIDVQLMDLRHELLESLDHAEIERRQPENGDRSIRRYPDRRQAT